MRVGVGRLSAPTRPSSSQRFALHLWLPSPWIAPSFGRTDHSPHRTVREDFPHTVPRHRTFPYGEVARHRRPPAASVSVRTPAHLIPVAPRVRGPTRHSTHPCPILGRGSGYAALSRPHARHVLFRPPLRCSHDRHARLAAASTRSRPGLLHRTPSYGQSPRPCAPRNPYCSWGARWRLSRHQR